MSLRCYQLKNFVILHLNSYFEFRERNNKRQDESGLLSCSYLIASAFLWPSHLLLFDAAVHVKPIHNTIGTEFGSCTVEVDLFQDCQT